MKKFSTFILARAGIISALYVVLSLITFPVASGAIQIRIAEGLTLLAIIYPESIISLTVGCLITNLITGCAVYDVIFGALITFVSGALTYISTKFIKNTALKILVGGIYPVVLNALLLPVIWYYAYGKLEYMYILSVLFLFIGQVVSVYGVGTPLYLQTRRLKEQKIRGF